MEEEPIDCMFWRLIDLSQGSLSKLREHMISKKRIIQLCQLYYENHTKIRVALETVGKYDDGIASHILLLGYEKTMLFLDKPELILSSNLSLRSVYAT